MTTPLEGIVILDWTQWQMGPEATAMMVDLGATVIHMEDRVAGDPGRALKSIAAVPDTMPSGRGAYFENHNRGKKSITVDLNKEQGRAIVYRLVKKVDVFVHNFRQGVPEKLGVDYETLWLHNPNLIYVASSGYGPKGPEAKEPSFDQVGQARSGIMYQVGEPGMPPLSIGGAIADQMGGIMTAYGILAALIARERLGVAQKVDVSHLGSMMALQGGTISRILYLGESAGQTRIPRARATNPLWNLYQCKDDKWIALAHMQPDRYWHTICQALGIEHLRNDPRYKEREARAEHCEELISIMDKVFMTKSLNEWLGILRAGGDIICTPVQSPVDLLTDPQVLANDYIIDYNHEAIGPVKVPGLPIQLSKTPGKIRAEAPEFGQHTEEILLEIGDYTWDDIAKFRDEEVI